MTSKRELDFSAFPPGTVTEYTTLVCLACIFDIFTKQFRLAPRSAYSESKRYSPPVKELTSRLAVRPFFDSDEKHPRCPYCNSAKRWHSRIDTQSIEGGKTSDAARRALVKTLAGSISIWLKMAGYAMPRRPFWSDGNRRQIGPKSSKTFA